MVFLTIKHFASCVAICALVVFFTWLVTLRTLFKFLRHPRQFFYRRERPLPPKVLEEGWNHAFLSLPNGIKLHYVYDGEESKPLMLFVHGFPEFWYSWRHQLREFKKDYRVVAIDTRGYGGSDKPTGIGAYDIAKLVNDVKETIEALGRKSCTLVAHDWGGAVCYQLVLQYPELVDKFVVMNCPHPKAFREHLYGGSLAQLLKSWYMFFFQMPYLPELFFASRDFRTFDNAFKQGCKNKNAFTDDDIEAYKFAFSQPGALTPPINYYRANIFRGDFLRGKVSPSTVQPPTLIVWGTEDQALGTPLAALSAKDCANATVHYVDGASHWVQMDEPRNVNAAMRKFLSH